MDSKNDNQFNRKRKSENKQENKNSNNAITENAKKIKLSNDGRLELLNFVDDLTLHQIQEASKNEDKEIEKIQDPLEQESNVSAKTSSTKSSNSLKRSSISSRNSNSFMYKDIAPLKTVGNFFGLSKEHKHFLLKLRGASKLYNWQEECLNLEAIHNRKNLIYSTPTSAGKTLVSEILMLREVLLRKTNVLFIVPYVSIVQEKVQEMMPLAVEFDFLIEEYCAGKGAIPPVNRRKKNSIFVCTIEKGQILLDSLLEAGRLGEISLVVVDELHMIGDSHRGHILESLLSKIIYFDEISIQIIGMSATISNLHEIAKFLVAETYTYNFRPVELKEFIKTGSDLYKVNNKAKVPSEILVKTDKIIGKSYTPQMLKRDPDHIGYFVFKAALKSSCLVFCATKANCENVALLIAESFPRNLKMTRTNEKLNLIAAMKSDLNGSLCPILFKTIPFGVAYHHSGLTTDERKHIEEAFHFGILTVICCTSTLAAGVNLPASRVIIRAPYVGQDFITLSQYKQMIGRAGRAGKSEKGDSILFCDKKDFHKVTKVLTSKMDDTISAYIKDISHFRSLILNLIGTKLANNFLDLLDYSKCMLSWVQQERFQKSMKIILIETLKELLTDGLVIQTVQVETSKTTPIFSITLNHVDIPVYIDNQFSINKLGKAAVNSGMSIEDAIKIKADLRKAHESLVLSQCLHLLYVVAPKEAIDSISLDYRIYSEIFLKLDSSLLNTARIIGINEKMAIKMIRKPIFSDDYIHVLKKFYVALILYDLWNGKDIFTVSKRFNVNRGIVHKLMYSASSQAYSIFKFCEVYDEFWIFKEIMEQFSKRLAYCCSTELLPLMELPAVKIARAKMMYSAGLRTVADIAALTPDDLIRTIKNINKKQAEQVIRAAKNSLSEQIDTLRAQMYEIKKSSKASTVKKINRSAFEG